MVTMSTIESTKEVLWLKGLIRELNWFEIRWSLVECHFFGKALGLSYLDKSYCYEGPHNKGDDCYKRHCS